MSHRAHAPANALAKRHYNCQSPDSDQYMPPGSCVCFVAGDPVSAVWGSSVPFAEYVKHSWAGAWINSIFRNEHAGIASELIRQAVAATRAYYGDPPTLGMVTFIDPKEVKPRMVRGRPTWGYSYFEAGFKHIGYTKAGLWAFQILPADMPDAEPAIGHQLELADAQSALPDPPTDHVPTRRQLDPRNTFNFSEKEKRLRETIGNDLLDSPDRHQ